MPKTTKKKTSTRKKKTTRPTSNFKPIRNKPIRYHGGKHYLVPDLVEIGSKVQHDRYLECCAGGLSYMLAKPYEGVAEWINDTNGELTNFWRVICVASLFDKFYRFVETLPLSQAEFERSKSRDYVPPATDDEAVEAAVTYFIRMRMSRQGIGKDYCTPTSRLRRGRNEQVSAWMTAVEGLPEVSKRLRRAEVWNRTADEAIRELDCESLLCYSDPPYFHATRTTTYEYGENEMSDEQHEKHLETLASMEGKFILSGYQNPLYDEFAKKNKWRVKKVKRPNASSAKRKKEIKVEVIWTNF